MSENRISSKISTNLQVSANKAPESIALNELDCALVEATKDWSQYLQFDASRHDTAIQDLSEDLMLRLNEFDHLLNMSKSDTRSCLFKQIPAIQDKFHELEDVFQKIDNLTHMVNRIRTDMEKVDKQLADAEATIETGSLQSFVPSLIGGAKNLLGSGAASALIINSISTQSDYSSSSSGLSATFEPITIFSTEDFFPSSHNSKEPKDNC